jgi:hypothetical protein
MIKRGDEKLEKISEKLRERSGENRRDNRNDGEVAPFVAIRGSLSLKQGKQRGAKSVSRELLPRDEIPHVKQLQGHHIRYFVVIRQKTHRT